jgi:hypothetical protein
MGYKLIKKEDSLEARPLVVVIYGDPGLGKTSLSFTTEEPLLLDFDQGVQRCIGRKDSVEFSKWEEVIDFLNDKALDQIKPKSIVIDTGGTMLDDFIGPYATRIDSKNRTRGGGVSLQGYGAMKEIFNNFVMKELKMRGINLIILCHAAESDDNGSKILRPKMTGGSKDILIAKADLMGYMYMDNGKRMLNFNPTDRTIGKNCAGFKPIVIQDAGTKEQATQLGDLIKTAQDHMSKLTEEQEQAIDVITKFKDALGLVMNIEDYDRLLLTYNEEPEHIRAQFKAHCKSDYISYYKREVLAQISKASDFNLEIDVINSNRPEMFATELKKALLADSKNKACIFDKETKKFIDKAVEIDKANG